MIGKAHHCKEVSQNGIKEVLRMESKKLSEWNQGYFPATTQASIHPEIPVNILLPFKSPPWLPNTDLKGDQTIIERPSNEPLTVTEQKNKNPSLKVHGS